jgi:hypothetical protein
MAEKALAKARAQTWSRYKSMLVNALRHDLSRLT